jgi:predicted site-specific integrase-resolvase
VKPFDRCDRATWPETLTRAQIAAIWQKSEHTIYRWTRQGFMRPMPMADGRWSKATVVRHLDAPAQRRSA